MAEGPLLRARLAPRTAPERSAPVFTWDEVVRVRVHPGQSVTSALLCAGVLATSRSLKYRRPRGPYCLRGDCGTCLVRIDGRPNLRACMVPARAGLRVLPQNRVGPRGLDPTALVDSFMGRMMDHHHFVLRPRLANEMMKDVARNLAGLGTLPDAVPAPARHRHARVQVVIVGGGPAGRAVDRALPPSISRVVLERREGRAVFGLYREDGLVAAATDGHGDDVLWTFACDHVVVANGGRDPMIPLPGNDLPGVVAARGLRALLDADALEPAVPVVVIGEGDHAREHAEALGARWVAPDRVAAIEGRSRVEVVALRDGERIACGLVALAADPAPATELARQAGARVRWDGRGFALERDADGRCLTEAPPHDRDPWTLWACGEVAGATGLAAATTDGERVARAIAHAITQAGASP